MIFAGDLDIDDSSLIEDAETFSGNAFKKAKFYFDKTGLLTLAEDSGIWVNALIDELGVKTRRWGAGENASDEEWVGYFLEKMQGVADRGAKFVCCACLLGEGVEKFFEGETRGVITENLQAPILKGLPLSSCFLPEGMEKVYAALSTEEKNRISHRGKAIKKAADFLNTIT